MSDKKPPSLTLVQPPVKKSRGRPKRDGTPAQARPRNRGYDAAQKAMLIAAKEEGAVSRLDELLLSVIADNLDDRMPYGDLRMPIDSATMLKMVDTLYVTFGKTRVGGKVDGMAPAQATAESQRKRDLVLRIKAGPGGS